MKKAISKSLLMLATAGLFMTSCGDENIGIEDHLIDIGDNGLQITIDKVSNLEPVKFNANVVGGVAKVDVMYNGTVLASVDNPESKFELILKRSDITGLKNSTTDAQNVEILATLSSGKVVKYLRSLTYSQAISLAAPKAAPIDKVDNEAKFIYTVDLSNASQDLIKDVKVYYTINFKEEVEVMKANGSWLTKTDTVSLDIAQLGLMAKDTISVRVLATSTGNFTSESTSETVLAVRSFDVEKSSTVAGITALNFNGIKELDDLKLTVPSLDGSVLNLMGLNGIELVAVPKETLASKDVNDIMNLFDNSGTKLSALYNVEAEMEYVFKTTKIETEVVVDEKTKVETTTKFTVVTYGVLALSEVVKPNPTENVAVPSVMIDYKLSNVSRTKIVETEEK